MSDKEKQEHTKTPWTWQDFGRGLILSSCSSGRPIVMDFARKGMHAAEPRFGKRTDNMGGIMVPLSEWEELPPDAAFLLRAVNAHDKLVEALKDAIAFIESNDTYSTDPEVKAISDKLFAVLTASSDRE